MPASATALAQLPPSSTIVDGCFLLLGLSLLAWAAVRGFLAERGAAAAAVAAAAVAGLVAHRSLLIAGGPAVVPAALVIAALAAGVFALGRILKAGAVFTIFDRAALASRPLPPARAGHLLPGLIAAGTVMAVLGPSVPWVLAGAILAIVCAAARRPSVRTAVPAVVAIAGLLPFLWLLHAIAGPEGLAVSRLADVPVSRAAEQLLAPLLGLGVFGFFALWPLQDWGDATLAPTGVAIVLRIGGPMLAGALGDWETVLIPVGVLALWHAAAVGKWSEALTAGAWLGAVAAASAGWQGGAPLLAAAAVVIGVAGDTNRSRIELARRVAAVLGASGGVLALRAVLQAQVVYGVLAAAAIAALLAGNYAPRPAVGAST